MKRLLIMLAAIYAAGAFYLTGAAETQVDHVPDSFLSTYHVTTGEDDSVL